MANQQDSYTVSQGTGTGNRDFSFTFPSFTESEVKVEIDNVVKTLTTHYTIVNHNSTSGGTVRFNTTGLPNGTAGTTPVRIFRQTDVDNPKATFTAGASLKAAEINDNFKQLRHALQEAIGAVATDRKVQRFNIEADAIDGSLIADDAIDSEHYTDGSIDHVHLSNDCIDGDNIQDDVINSEHYAPLSIDTEHIGNSQVTSIKIADSNVTTGKIADNAVTGAKISDNLDIPDGNKIRFGNSQDLEVYHDGSHSYIKDTKANGVLYIDGSGTAIRKADGGETIAGFTADGPVDLYHTGSKKLETTSAGVTITGTLTADLADNSIDSEHYVDGSIDREHLEADIIDGTKLADNAVDSEHYTDGSIDRVHLEDDIIDGTKLADNAVNTEHVTDDSITGAKLSNNLDIPDGNKIRFGNSADLEIYHDGSHSYIKDTKADGVLYIDGTGTAIRKADGSETIAGFTADGSVDLYHNGSKKFETTAAGATVTGTLTADLADNSIDSEHYVDGSIDTIHIANDAVTADKIADAVIVTNSEQASHSVNDTTFFTTAAAEARYFNASTGETIKDGQSFPDNDTTIATTAAINDRIIDLVDDVGGFVPIASETAFPSANPDVNNGSGTLVSIKAIGSTRTPSSGTVTIANGSGSNTVTITGCGSTVLTAGFGVIVETTSTLHTYAFHRLVPKATEVTTVASNITNIVNAGSNSTNINAVAGNATNINTVAGISGNVTTVANNDSNVTAVANNSSNINSAVSNASNINTVAGSISNVNTTAGSISNVNTVASNISSVNSFFNTYRIGSTNPTTSLDTGDLFFNTSTNSLKVYTGSAWVDGVTATGNFALKTGNTFTGSNIHNDNVKSFYGTDSDLEIYHDGQHGYIKDTKSDGVLYIDGTGTTIRNAAGTESCAGFTENGSVDLYYNGSKKFETTATGATVTGNFTATGASNQLGNTTIVGGGGAGGVGLTLEYNSSDVWSVNNIGKVTMTGDLDLQDNDKLLIGTGDDLQIYHDGSLGSYIDSNNGYLYLRGDSASTIRLQPVPGENSLMSRPNAGVELYYDNAKKLETTSSGIAVTGNIEPDGNLKLDDNRFVYFGSGDSTDLYIGHEPNHSRHLFRSGDGATKMLFAGGSETMMVLQPQGAVELYHDNSKKFETTSEGVLVTNLHLGDLGFIELGASDDFRIYHDGTDSYLYNLTGEFKNRAATWKVVNQANNESMIVATENGAAELYYDNSKKFQTGPNGFNSYGSSFNLEGTDSGAVNLRLQNTTTGNGVNDGFLLQLDSSEHAYVWHREDKNLLFGTNNSTRFLITNDGHLRIPNDSGKLQFGASQDLQIYHTGTHSIIQDAGTGNLRILTNNLRLENAAGTENQALFFENGAVELYYDNNKKFETQSGGAQVNGSLNVTGELNLTSNGAKYLDVDTLTNSNSFTVRHRSDTNVYETAATFAANGGATFTHNGNTRFATTSDGATVTGSLTVTDDITLQDDLLMGDGDIIKMGDSNDLQLFHDGSTNIIDCKNDRNLKIVNDTAGGNETMALFDPNGAVELYFNGNKKLETLNTGTRITGSLGVECDPTDKLEVSNGHTGSNTGTGIKLSQGYNSAYSRISSNFGGSFGLHAGVGAGVPEINFILNTTQICKVKGSAFQPSSNNTYDLGTNSVRWRNIYTNDLHLSNEGHSNDVDGTWGNWTIQEGESDLFLKNNRSGKKYKFNLMEVS